MGKLLSLSCKKKLGAFVVFKVGGGGREGLCLLLEASMVGYLLPNVSCCETDLRLSDPPLMMR
jgi:hypothetical protein